jgi:ABC-2 type transport system permease protein
MSYIWEVVLQAGFYAAPIIYPLSIVPPHYAKYARFLLLNPLAQIIQDARYVLISRQTETIDQAFGTHWARAIPVGITIILAVTSIAYFRSKSASFAEEA